MYSDTDISHVPEFTLHPRWGTALLDSIGRFVTELGEQLSAAPQERRPGTVIVVIMTDGLENSSLEWTPGTVRTLITQQREQYQWEFIFLGANMDAVKVGTSYGVAPASAMTYQPSPLGAEAAYQSMSELVFDMREHRPTGFSDEHRRRARGE